MAGGFLGSGKGDPQQAKSAADPTLSRFAEEFADVSRPTRNLVFGQVEEALRTGGIGARIPAIGRAEEQSRAATSRALRGTEESLAVAGIAGTPFGERVRAETRLAGEQATAAIGPGIAREFINIAPNLALGSAGTVISGLTSAADVGVRQLAIGTSASIAQMQALAQLMSSAMTAGGLAAT